MRARAAALAWATVLTLPAPLILGHRSGAGGRAPAYLAIVVAWALAALAAWAVALGPTAPRAAAATARRRLAGARAALAVLGIALSLIAVFVLPLATVAWR